MASKLLGFLSEQVGINLPRLVNSLRGTSLYFADLISFKRGYSGKISLRPCLHDRFEEGGSAGGEYFIQDLYVARMIHRNKPDKHVDIGSRIDGFVAHVASYRTVEVWDIRPITKQVQGIQFRQANLMNADESPREYSDSISCLHALEHFGLGRYGDPVDPEGSRRGLQNIATALREDGMLYLSVPLGEERALFNSHRIFDPRTIVRWARESGLVLHEFATLSLDDVLVEHEHGCWPDEFERIERQPYVLGIFTFRRITRSVVVQS